MPYKLNEVPNLIIDIFLAHQSGFKTSLDNVLAKETFSSWPNNVMLKQDGFAYIYVQALGKLLFNENNIAEEDESKLVLWQIKQSYRILNAVISSIKVTIPLKKILIKFRNNFEKSEEVRTWLEEIEQAESKPDVVCYGHGGAFIEDGVISNAVLARNNVKIVFYAGFGSTMTNSVGYAIENGLYYPSEINVTNEETNATYSADKLMSYPRLISSSSSETILPNFILGGEANKMKGRLIECGTGRILLHIGSKKEMSLLNIIEFCQGRQLHWAACSEIGSKKKPSKLFGKYKNHFWSKPKSSKIPQARKRPKPTHFARFHRPATPKNDATLSIKPISMKKSGK